VTSPRQRAANRRNALHSTGPKTTAGRRRVATNAISHGLSVPVDPLIQQDLINPILDRLASEDLPEPVRLDLATKIAEFERNIAHQRERFADSMSGQEPAPRDVLGIDEVFIEDILDLKLEAEQDAFGGGEQAEFLKEAKAALKSLRSWGDRQAKRVLNEELRSTERYYRRAANQLIKTLRAL
jgi:hypothetical protein